MHRHTHNGQWTQRRFPEAALEISWPCVREDPSVRPAVQSVSPFFRREESRGLTLTDTTAAEASSSHSLSPLRGRTTSESGIGTGGIRAVFGDS